MCKFFFNFYAIFNIYIVLTLEWIKSISQVFITWYGMGNGKSLIVTFHGCWKGIVWDCMKLWMLSLKELPFGKLHLFDICKHKVESHRCLLFYSIVIIFLRESLYNDFQGERKREHLFKFYELLLKPLLPLLFMNYVWVSSVYYTWPRLQKVLKTSIEQLDWMGS